ncbi:MAG: hypothetical protein GDA56_06435 [Hormoscilla sp. GM7CHS1pb]|nr:hypothetical protein [Hormoscilla sp. GM7CHS1pb]
MGAAHLVSSAEYKKDGNEMAEEITLLQVRIPKELQVRSEAIAARDGKSIQEWVTEAIKMRLLYSESQETESLTSVEKAVVFTNWVESHSHSTPLLDDAAVSRESIYLERG